MLSKIIPAVEFPKGAEVLVSGGANDGTKGKISNSDEETAMIKTLNGGYYKSSH